MSDGEMYEAVGWLKCILLRDLVTRSRVESRWGTLDALHDFMTVESSTYNIQPTTNINAKNMDLARSSGTYLSTFLPHSAS